MSNVFKIFNLEPSFILNLDELKENFLKILSKKMEEVKDGEEENSVEDFLRKLNYAHSVISSPLRRIRELLKILSEENREKNLTQKNLESDEEKFMEEEKFSDDFFKEIFKLNCEVEEIKKFDSNILNVRLNDFIKKISELINSFSKDIQKAYEEKDAIKLKHYMHMLSFYNKIYSNAKESFH